MRSKLLDLVSSRLRGFCILTTLLLTAVFTVHRSSFAAVEVIATGINDISGFRMDGNDLYFVTDYHSANCALKKVAKAGGVVTTVIDGAAHFDSGSYRGIEGSFVVDNDTIYGGYGGYVYYTVFKASKVGGSVTNLASISGGGFIGVSEKYLYYSSGFSSINRMSDDGTGLTTLLTGYWVRSFGMDSTGIYFVDYGSKNVQKYDLNTSEISTLISGNAGEGGIVIDSNNVYFFLNGMAKKVSKNGGSVTTLAGNINGGISDDAYLYFVQDKAIKKIPVNGGTISTVATEYTSSVSGMAVDDTYLYWGDISEGIGAGKIVRTPKSSSNTFVIQPGPEGIDTYYGTVYITNGAPDATSLYMGGWGDWYYDFFMFDLTGSPSAAETVSAKLYLYGSAPNDPKFRIHRIIESWTESGVTLANNPASVFYKKFGSFAVGSDGWNSVDITTLYKNWKKGKYPNYGVKLVPTRNNHTNGGIASSDNENSAIRPKIIVTSRASKDVIEAGTDMSRK